ncbi:conjugal transfer protein TraF [Vibrio astriarenae]
MAKFSSFTLSAIALTVAGSAQAHIDSRSFAMGGTGVAAATYLTSSLHNPALASQYGQSDDFGIILPSVSVSAHDSDDLIDNIDRFDDAFEQWEHGNEAARSEWEQALRDMQGDVMTAEVSTGIIIALPNKYLSTNFFTQLKANVIAIPEVDEQDLEITSPDDTLNSSATGLGGATLDIGLTFAKEVNWLERPLHIGVSPKIQQILALGYNESMDNVDEDEFDFDDANTESGFNLDLGLAYSLAEHWNIGFTARNVISRELETNEYQGETATYLVEPEYKLGISYDIDWFTITSDIDLNKKSYFEQIDYQTQYARIGTELDAWEWAQLRLGYQHSMTDDAEDVITAGMGLKPFGLIGLDLSGSYGKDNNYGVSAQLIMHF